MIHGIEQSCVEITDVARKEEADDLALTPMQELVPERQATLDQPYIAWIITFAYYVGLGGHKLASPGHRADKPPVFLRQRPECLKLSREDFCHLLT